MRLESVRSVVATEIRKIDKTDRKTADDRSKAVAKDSAKFSSAFTSSAQETKGLAARIAIEPEIREERISDVKEKIKNGFYNSEEFADQLADKLAGQFLDQKS